VTNEAEFYFLRALLLAMLEHPVTRRKAERIICDSGDIWLHALIPTIPKNPKLHSMKKIIYALERQLKARDVIGLMELNGEL
jgi:hypothetical protein